MVMGVGDGASVGLVKRAKVCLLIIAGSSEAVDAGSLGAQFTSCTIVLVLVRVHILLKLFLVAIASSLANSTRSRALLTDEALS